MREPSDAELRARGEVPSVVVIAKKGCGKTTYMRWLIGQSCATTDWCVCDPEEEYWPRMFGERATIVDASGMRRLTRPAVGHVYILRDTPGEEAARIALDMGHCAFVHDECDQDVGKDSFVDRESWLYRMANRNRQHMVAAYWLFRRPADVWQTIQVNCTHAVIGYVQDARDIARIEDLCGSETAALATALPPPSRDGVSLVEVNLSGERRARTVFVPHNYQHERRTAP